MKISKILCPVDHSSDCAIDYASRLARATGASLHFLYVEVSPMPQGIGLAGQLPSPLGTAKNAMRERRPTTPGVRFTSHVEIGDAAEQIVSFARNNDIDVIVMGCHGRTGVKRFLLGSVAEAVMRSAHCAVITVKPPIGIATPNSERHGRHHVG